jgi:hypothetical protein
VGRTSIIEDKSVGLVGDPRNIREHAGYYVRVILFKSPEAEQRIRQTQAKRGKSSSAGALNSNR